MSALVDTVPLIGHVVGGQVTTPDGARTQDVLNPATGEVSGRLLLACLLYTSPSPRDS